MIILFGIVLKIPVGFGIWLVWWASREYDEMNDEAPGTSEDHGFRRWRRQPKTPAARAAAARTAALSAYRRIALPAGASGRRRSSRA